ncbi:hypothetical protein GJ496_007243 [Pomphorhynchus laevis]|nr:hypothetical protein GJ496_007243 [Pomphorhynchus laevis]
MIALKKSDGGLRPIAVGNTLRRMVDKISCRRATGEAVAVLSPFQVGVGVPSANKENSEKHRNSTSEKRRSSLLPAFKPQNEQSCVKTNNDFKSISPMHQRGNVKLESSSELNSNSSDRVKQLLLSNAKVPPHMRCMYATEENGLLTLFDEKTIRSAKTDELIERIGKFNYKK